MKFGMDLWLALSGMCLLTLNSRLSTGYCQISANNPQNCRGTQRFSDQHPPFVQSSAFFWRVSAWDADAADRLCRRLHLFRGGDPFAMPAPPPRAQSVAYFRLHGVGGYRYSFSDADLRWLVQQLRGYEEAWVLFNNMSMWDDARRFKRLLARVG